MKKYQLFMIKKSENGNHWIKIGIGREVDILELNEDEPCIEILLNYIPLWHDFNLRDKNEDEKSSGSDDEYDPDNFNPENYEFKKKHFEIIHNMGTSKGNIRNTVGMAFLNKDNSINLKVDMIPFTRIIILVPISEEKPETNKEPEPKNAA